MAAFPSMFVYVHVEFWVVSLMILSSLLRQFSLLSGASTAPIFAFNSDASASQHMDQCKAYISIIQCPNLHHQIALKLEVKPKLFWVLTFPTCLSTFHTETWTDLCLCSSGPSLSATKTSIAIIPTMIADYVRPSADFLFDSSLHSFILFPAGSSLSICHPHKLERLVKPGMDMGTMTMNMGGDTPTAVATSASTASVTSMLMDVECKISVRNTDPSPLLSITY